MDFRQSQFFTALKLLIVPFIGGGLGYYAIGLLHPELHWSLFNCFYMSTITLTTVGYAETLDGMEHLVIARAYTMILSVFGTGFLVYAVSTFTAFIIEGELGTYLEKRRMDKVISTLTGHYIVCGAGTTGMNVVRELIETDTTFVIVERDEKRLRKAKDLGAKLAVQGDATTDEALIAAGIERARGLVACLADDKDNLFVTVTARDLNRKLRIVAKNVERNARDKLINAGATSAVSPSLIGGLRLASELIRPSVVSYLDVMLRDKTQNVRFAEVTVAEGSDLAGKTLGEANLLERVGLSVHALRLLDDGRFVYNPRMSERLTPGTVLIVLGSVAEVQSLERLAAS